MVFASAVTQMGLLFSAVGGVDPTLPVGSFDPNPWGLYDVHGNVHEWTRDQYTRSYDTPPDTLMDKRVVRGGSWKHRAGLARSEMRLEARTRELDLLQELGRVSAESRKSYSRAPLRIGAIFR